MSVMGVRRFTEAARGREGFARISSQMLLTNDTGSTGGLVLKKITVHYVRVR